MLTKSASASMHSFGNDQETINSRYLMLIVVLSLETLAINLARLPDSMRFERFAFCDHGANLTLHYLITSGLRPSLDFGYHYGLLPTLVGRFWFGLFGATPWAYQGAMLIADLLCAWAVAKILFHLQIRGLALALVCITLVYAYQATYVNFAHATEAVLLSHAVAEQARGARSNALALATAAVFCKPSMGYVYGLLLVILILHDLIRSGFSTRRFLAALAPATTMFLVIAATVLFAYGSLVLFHTVFPIEGVTNYRALNFGLMRAGRELWDKQDLPWIFYLIDVSGFWVVGSIFLLGSALLRVLDPGESSLSLRRSELVVTCALLHLAFLVVFFGNQWSWIYYSYVLMVGIAIACSFSPGLRRVNFAFCILAVMSTTDVVYVSHRLWQIATRDASTAGLWATAEERGEWLSVRALVQHQPKAMLDEMGGAELLFQDFEKPVSLYLVPGLMTEGDINRKLNQLSTAQFAIVPITIAACSGVPDAPELKDALKRDFELAWSGKDFEVFRRHDSTSISQNTMQVSGPK